MNIPKELVERWFHPPWNEAIAILADPACTKDQFDAMILRIYPNGGSIHTSNTFRGKAELIDFRGVTLSKINLQNVDLYKLDLSFSDFSESNISLANFCTTQLEGSNFSAAIAQDQVNFSECFARDANFSKIKLINGLFWGSDLSGANFSNATFDRCDFSHSILKNATLAGAEMTDCDVQGLQLSSQEKYADWFQKSTFKNVNKIIWIP